MLPLRRPFAFKKLPLHRGQAYRKTMATGLEEAEKGIGEGIAAGAVLADPDYQQLWPPPGSLTVPPVEVTHGTITGTGTEHIISQAQ